MTLETSLTLDSPLQQALALQKKAYLEHPVPSLQERQRDLDQLAQFVRDHQEELTAAISADYGHRSRHETLITEIAPVLAGLRHTRKHLARWMRPQRRHIDRLTYGLAHNTVIPQPLGVVGVIVPWNFPINLSLVPLTTLLAAGNRAMIKMSENSRHLAALLMARLPAYFPPEKLQVFDETGGVGEQFSKLAFDHLLFTGSSNTGKAVMAAAAQNLCPVTLELGGKSPAILAEDFDLEKAAERILFVKYLNAGQICTTVDHLYLPRHRMEDFVAAAKRIVPKRYADLHSKDYTSVISPRAYERLKDWLEEARARGAQVIPLLPGPAWDDSQHRLAPHLVINAPPDCMLMQREIFGPILPLVAYEDLDSVIDQINAGPRPLAIYPFSHRASVIDRLIERVMSGGVTINDALLHVAQDDLPFGGVGESGMGHYHGVEGFHTFSKLRPIFHQARWSTLQLLYPPYGGLANAVLKFLGR